MDQIPGVEFHARHGIVVYDAENPAIIGVQRVTVLCCGGRSARAGTRGSGPGILGDWSAVVAIVALAAFSHAFLASSSALAQGRASAVVVERAEPRQVVDTRSVIGQLVAPTEAAVAVRAPGIVKQVLFEIGDQVTQGQELVRLDDALIRLERDQAAAALVVAKAGVAVAEAKLRLSRQSFERQARLKGSTAFSKGRFEDLEQEAAQAASELAEAQARVTSASAALARADYLVEHASIRAPFAGVVVARQAQPGAYVTVGSAVATLMDLEHMEIAADVPAALVAGLSPGQQVTARLEAGLDVAARVRAIVPVQNAATQTIAVRFVADLSKLDPTRIISGRSITLAVPASEERIALTVPKDALVQGRNGWTVFAVIDGKAMARPVSLGDAVGERIEVRDGVAAGDLLVVRGNERLRDGQAVTAETTPEPAAGSSEGGQPLAGQAPAGGAAVSAVPPPPTAKREGS
ncbi:MAG: efflux RND transporter periplasmic adaptor subunit [Rhizobiales bacterium]|nr:efflux RND transporter periplasmic adaptor subunit [Hyphomicrobiales bacterium]